MGLHSLFVVQTHTPAVVSDIHTVIVVSANTHILYTQRGGGGMVEMMKLYEIPLYLKLMILQISSSEPVHTVLMCVLKTIC